MWIVVDWHCTELFGPFETKEKAEDWLAEKNGIQLGQYAEQEVSIHEVKSLDARLTLVPG